MRFMLRKFSGHITGEMIWTPVVRQLGANLRGLRIQEGSVLIEPRELENFIRTYSKEQMIEYLYTLELCYPNEDRQVNNGVKESDENS